MCSNMHKASYSRVEHPTCVAGLGQAGRLKCMSPAAPSSRSPVKGGGGERGAGEARGGGEEAGSGE